MATNNRQPLNMKSVKSIMNKRDLLTSKHIGRRVQFSIQGNGTTIDVEDKDKKKVLSTQPGSEGVVLQKTIYNLRVNSELAMTNVRNKTYLLDAIAAEKAGDVTGADEAYTKWLNAIQVSFSIILPSKLEDELVDGAEIAAKIIKLSTDNGELYTIEPSTISIVRPDVLETTKIDFDSLVASLSDDDEDEDDDLEETEEEKAIREKAEAKAAAKAAKAALAGK